MTEECEDITLAFDSWAERYDQEMKEARYFSPEWITNHVFELEGTEECRVLDLGCGTGDNVRVLSELRQGIRAHGIDISPRMLEFARKTNRYELLQAHDLENPLPNMQPETFDLVIAFGFLELLSDVNLCLSECIRVLKVDGTLWASFRRFEEDDAPSSSRRMSVGGMTVNGYSADQILQIVTSLNFHILSLSSVVGYITETGSACTFYVLSARKMQAV